VNRETQATVLFLLGAAVLRVSLSDLYLRYVKAGLRPLLLVAGVMLIAAAAATLWYAMRAARAARAARVARPAGAHGVHAHGGGASARGGDAHGGDAHGHREPRVAWLLLLPVFALILVVPPALGSYAANRTGTSLPRPPGFPTLPAGDPLKLSVLDYATRAVYDHGRSLGDRRVKITGFITVGRRGEPYLTRIAVNCCAADGLPVKVGLSGEVPTDLRADGWVEVVGTYTDRQTKDSVNGGPIPYIAVTETRTVPAPAEQYES
jgi:uncharacterized repeat protein (TIGR03943 family)